MKIIIAYFSCILFYSKSKSEEIFYEYQNNLKILNKIVEELEQPNYKV
jgi:hypothetical protein